MTDIKAKIGHKIKLIRKQKGFTQEKLAELIGIEPQSMSYMETGRFAPSPDTLQKLSEVLGVEPYEFYYFNEPDKTKMQKELISAIKKDEKLLKTLYSVYKSIEFV